MSSVYGDILTAVQRVVQDLGLPGLLPEQVKRRKGPVYLAEHDAALPLIVVSPSQDHPDGLQFSDGLFVGYEVRLAIYQETAFAWDDMDWILAAREDLRQALHVTALAGAPTVFDSEWLPNPVFDTGPLAQGVEVSRMAFVYASSEGRTG